MTENLNLLEVEMTDKIVADLIPEWKNCDIDVSVLSGGITNLLYRAKCDKGDVAIRIYGDKTEMFIDREREASALKQMGDAQISSKLIKYLPEKNVTIVEMITDGYTLNNDDFLRDDWREIIVDPIRRIHSSGAFVDYIFNPYKQCIKMYNILENIGAVKNFSEFDFDGTLKKLKKLIGVIDMGEEEYVFTHNDLLADNFIKVTDEYKDKFEKPLYIIDWEYAGMAPRYYDVADMLQEILVPRDVEISIIEHYCEGKDFDKTLYYCDMFKPFPDIYWFLWSLIQKTVSTIDFDFYKYGRDKYVNAQNNIKLLETDYNVKI